jgi:hypothetical protein
MLYRVRLILRRLSNGLPSRRICRSHTLRDLGTALARDDSNVVLALQFKPEWGTISKMSTEPHLRSSTGVHQVCL